MPRVSRRPISTNLDLEIKENFSSLISSLNNQREIQHFFNEFVTHEEQTMLGKRLLLHLMLERGYKSAQIQTFLGISKDTIRVHKALWERGDETYKLVLKKISKKAENRQLWKKIEKILRPAELFVKGRNDMKARAKFASGDWD